MIFLVLLVVIFEYEMHLDYYTQKYTQAVYNAV